MSRFADVAATRKVGLGPCECPDTPHDEDWARLREELAGPEIERFVNTIRPEDTAAVLAEFIPEWNLLGPDGSAWEPTAEHILLLRAPTISLIVQALQTVIESSSAVPNAPGAPSQSSSRASASPTRTTRTKP